MRITVIGSRNDSLEDLLHAARSIAAVINDSKLSVVRVQSGRLVRKTIERVSHPGYNYVESDEHKEKCALASSQEGWGVPFEM